MSDNFTSQPAQSSAHPFASQLAGHGVPQEVWPYLSEHGLGGLAQKLGIVFSTFSV